MSYLKTAAEFTDAAKRIATQYLTSYMLGPWGWPANDKMIVRACSGSHGAENKTWLSYANRIKDKGYLFDCVGLIKGILWGWNGDPARTYGGAGYACNGVPDYDALGMINCCKDVSTDFSTIVLGEVVYMPGHIGIYVGDGMVSEATPKWQWGVQLSTCLNVAGKQLPGTVGSRTWTKHGKLPWVDYSAADKINEEDNDMTEEQVRKLVRDEYAKIEAERAELPVSAWAAEDLAAQVAAGVTDGKRPQAYATRQEVAVMMGRKK